jgi:hypothetical protein
MTPMMPPQANAQQDGFDTPQPDMAEFHARLSGMAPDAPDPDEKPEPTPERLALVKRMQANIKLDKAHWKKRAFDRMKFSMQMTRDGADKAWKDSGLYVANILQRHVAQKTAGLYAKNPTVRAERRKTMDFKMWDGSPQTLQAAAMDPANNMALIQDVQQGALRRRMLDGVAQTLQIVAQHEISEQTPPLKISAKSMVSRTIICGVGYMKLSYTRHMVPAPEVLTETSNLEARMSYLEGLIEAEQDDDEEDIPGQCEALRLAMAEMKAAPLVVSSEGVRFDWPASDAIIPDRKLKDLRGFQGCDYVTEQMLLTTQQVEEMFGTDIEGAGTNYYTSEDAMPVQSRGNTGAENGDANNQVMVWCAYHRRDGLVTRTSYPNQRRRPSRSRGSGRGSRSR